jgi:predicted transcriptional regulator
MARRRSAALTDGELRIMRVLWNRGRGTVGEIAERIEDSPKPAYNSVLTMLRILETKGYVRHEKDGRAFVYAPVIDRSEARRSAVSHLLHRFFDGSPELLVLDLLGHDETSPAEMERLRDLINGRTLHAAERVGGPLP